MWDKRRLLDSPMAEQKRSGERRWEYLPGYPWQGGALPL